jgi:hypothetical protein
MTRKQRERQQQRFGMGLIIAALLSFAMMVTAAYQIDKARGISVDQSLRSAGF